MTTIATIVCLVLVAAVVVGSGVRALRNQVSDTPDVLVAGVLELGVLLYAVVRIVDLSRGHHPPSTGLTVAYVVGIVLTMPIAALLGLAERSRWGPVVFVAGALVVAVLLARIDQTWT